MKRSFVGHLGAMACLTWLLAAAPAPAHAQVELVTDMVSLRLQLRGQMLVEHTDFGTGNTRLDDRTDLSLRRFRVTFTGMYDDTYGVVLNAHAAPSGTKNSVLGYNPSADADYNDGNIRLLDAYMMANYNDHLNFKIGLSKIPMTRGNLDGCFDPMGIDRSIFSYTGYGSSPIKFSRDMGVTMWGKAFGARSSYSLAAFQGREGFAKATNPFSGAAVSSSQTPGNTLLYVGRLHYSFLDTEDGSGYEGTYLGDLKVLTFGVGFGHESDAVYKNVSSAGAVQNDETVDYNAFTADVLFEYPTASGTYTLTSAYINVDFDDAYKTNMNPGDRMTNIGGMQGQKKGWYARAGYLFPQTIGKEGKLQPYARYEEFDVAFVAGVTEQTITQKAAGINWYIHGQNVRLTVEYERNEFAKPTGMIGGRVNASFQPIDLITENSSLRALFQVAF